jgi:hypothetical protein
MLTLAFGIQTKTSFLEYEKQVIFNMTLFEGEGRVSDLKYQDVAEASVGRCLVHHAGKGSG